MRSPYTLLVAKIVVVLFLLYACDNLFNSNSNENKKPNIGDSLDPIEEVTLIGGAENATLIVNINREKDAYFDIGLGNIESNEIIDNGLYDAWCIDVRKSINGNNGRYEKIKLYSTYLVELWKPVNYLLNIQSELRKNDPEISWLEIQLAVWSLRAYPEFDLDTAALEDLPAQFRKDGEPTFNKDKVGEVLDIIQANYQDFDYEQRGSKFAIAADMPVDVQTVIMVVEKK